MTTSEWNSLTTGSVVSNKNGTNHRVVLKWNPGSRTIILPTNRGWYGRRTTIYCHGDKNNFKLIKIKVRLKNDAIQPKK